MPTAIDVSFRADISNLTKSLAQLPDVTTKEAKAMVKALEKSLVQAEKAAERAAKATAKSWKGASKATEDVGDETKKLRKQLKGTQDQAGEADSVMKALGGAIGTISPEAERALSTMGDLAGGVEAAARSGTKLAVGLGVVGVAVGVAALAWNHYAGELEEAEKKTRDMADATDRMARAAGAFKTSRARAELELLVAKGEAQASTLDELDAKTKAASVTSGLMAEHTATRAGLEKRLSEAMADRTQWEIITGHWLGKNTDAESARAEEIERTRQAIARQNKAIATLSGQEADLNAVFSEGAAIKRADTKETKRGTQATTKQKDAIKELIAETAKLSAAPADRLDEIADSIDELIAASMAGGDAVAKRLAPALAQAEAAFDRIDAERVAVGVGKLRDEAAKYGEVETPIAKAADLLERLQRQARMSADAAQELAPAIADVSARLDEMKAIGDPIQIDEGGALPVLIQNTQILTAETDRLSEAQTEYARIHGETSDAIGARQEELAAQLRGSWASVKDEMVLVFTTATGAAGQFADAAAQFASLATDEIVGKTAEEMEARGEMSAELEDKLKAVETEITHAQSEEQRARLEGEAAALEAKIAQTEENTEALRAIRNEEIAKSFRQQQSLQVASAVMNTAAAVIRSWAELGPIAGPIMGAAATAIGAAQIATIQAQEPPTAHLGGLIGQRPDERMIRARAGEGVLTAQGVAAVGGAQGIANANAGAGAGGPIVVQQVYKHRVLDTVLTDSIKRGGPISSAINKRSRRGRRNPHRKAG